MSLTRTPALVFGATPRVNLLPPAERARREQSRLARRWATAAGAALAVVLVATLVAMLLARSARADLEDEQARTTTLAQQLAAYQDVAAATGAKAAYESYRAQAMASDVRWTDVFGALSAALPGGARITGFDAVIGADAAAAVAASGDAPAGTASPTPPSGTAVAVTVQVTSMQPPDQRDVVTRLGRVPGVLGAQLTSLTSASSASYTSTTSVFFDDTFLSHSYDQVAP